MKHNRTRDYLEHMLQAAENALNFVGDGHQEDFLSDIKTQQAVVMSLMIIGESATKIMDRYPEFAQHHHQIAWRSMRGMRNRIAHGYFEINMEIVWETVQTALPELIQKLQPIIAHMSVTTDE